MAGFLSFLGQSNAELELGTHPVAGQQRFRNKTLTLRTPWHLENEGKKDGLTKTESSQFS